MAPELMERIEINTEVNFGKPVSRSTRVTLELPLEKLAADIPIEETLAGYPALERGAVLAPLAYARQAVGT